MIKTLKNIRLRIIVAVYKCRLKYLIKREQRRYHKDI